MNEHLTEFSLVGQVGRPHGVKGFFLSKVFQIIPLVFGKI